MLTSTLSGLRSYGLDTVSAEAEDAGNFSLHSSFHQPTVRGGPGGNVIGAGNKDTMHGDDDDGMVIPTLGGTTDDEDGYDDDFDDDFQIPVLGEDMGTGEHT